MFPAVVTSGGPTRGGLGGHAEAGLPVVSGGRRGDRHGSVLAAESGIEVYTEVNVQ